MDTLLVVDDSPLERRRLAALLSRAGYRVVLAETGEAALALVAEVQPDLVLLDVDMPGLDGFAVCARLQARPDPSDLPVLLLTARSGEADRVRGLRGGAVDYVTKPFRPQELLARIAGHLRQKKLRDQERERRLDLERHLHALEAQLRHADRLASLGVVAAGVFHELKTPLAYLRAQAEHLARVARQSADGQTFRAALEEATAAFLTGTERMAALLRGAQVLTRAQEGPVQVCDLREPAEEALVLVGGRLRGRVRVRREWPGALPVLADPGQLIQVFTNLFLNAADAMGEAGGTLYLRGAVEASRARVSVRDTGPGVPPALRQRIFELFFTTKEPGVGTGLGLPISRQILARFGGTLELAPPGAGGAEFRVLLPLAPRRRPVRPLATPREAP